MFSSPAQNTNENNFTSRAESIKSFDSVPQVYKEFFFAEGFREFPYTVFTPGYEIFIPPTTEKLICDFGREIYVLERNGDSFNAVCFPLERISYIEVKTILLESSIKIRGITKDNVPHTSIFRFNSLTDYLFTPILLKIRQATIFPRPIKEFEKFDSWRDISFKLMNYAKRSLLSDERVIHTILQPEIHESTIQFGGERNEKYTIPTLASILTNRELIMIRAGKILAGKDIYGGVWDYIPLRKILTLTLAETESKLLSLSVCLTEGTHLEYLFQPTVNQDLNLLQYHIKELIIT